MQQDVNGLCTLMKCSPSDIPKVIVYVPTKNTACKVYHFLRAAFPNKKSVGMSHADLTQATKYSVYEKSCSVVRCLVATIAFGLVCGNDCVYEHVHNYVHVHDKCIVFRVWISQI